VAQYFSQEFDGNCMEVGSMSFSFIEKSIFDATTLPVDGDKIFHSHVLAGINVSLFFKEEFKGQNWRVKIRKEW